MATIHMEKLLNDLSSEFLECPICLDIYDEDACTPRYYPCLHTACQQCMTQQFKQIVTGIHVIRCPLCMRVFAAPTRDVTLYKKSIIVMKLKAFHTAKMKAEFCDKCPHQFSDAYCKDCDLNLCKSCCEAIHIGNSSSHNVISGVRKQDLPKDACHMCLEKSDMYCQTCKFFFCNKCGDVQHSDTPLGTHVIFNENSYLQAIHYHVGSAVQTCNDWMHFIFGLLLIIAVGFFLVFLIFLLVKLLAFVVYIHSYPAAFIIPPEEVEPVNIICRQRTREEVLQDEDKSQTQLLRTICTFNVFHYNLLNRKRTYFVIDIDIDIAKTYEDGSDEKLFSIKTFHLHKEQNTYHKQRNRYWSVTRCRTWTDQLAICIEDVAYRRDYRMSRKIISRVVKGQNKTVSFLFLVDNERKVMEIVSPAHWNDTVLLEQYYESQTLSVWIPLADSKNDKYITARIRSGVDVTIRDLSTGAIGILIGLLKYPFRFLATFL